MKITTILFLASLLFLAGCNDPRKKQQAQPEPPSRIPYAAQYFQDNY